MEEALLKLQLLTNLVFKLFRATDKAMWSLKMLTGQETGFHPPMISSNLFTWEIKEQTVWEVQILSPSKIMGISKLIWIRTLLQ